ncbi:MAG: hypothetical protein VYE77_11545 [Planctomycetota bacterium]|nr:hypothetical protein [Planctomycetota bacterium]
MLYRTASLARQPRRRGWEILGEILRDRALRNGRAQASRGTPTEAAHAGLVG